MEIWKDVKGYEGLYQVSNLGAVRSIDRISPYGRRLKGVIRRITVNKNGYAYVNLSINGEAHNFTVHRLVAIAFVPNPHGLHTVNHINENKLDNRAENLEWVTLADNLRYGTHTERATKHKPDMSGSHHFNYGKRGADAVTHKGKVIGTCKDDPNVIIEFDTAASASRFLGVSSGQLCDAINGKAKSCGGYVWRRCSE